METSTEIKNIPPINPTIEAGKIGTSTALNIPVPKQDMLLPMAQGLLGQMTNQANLEAQKSTGEADKAFSDTTALMKMLEGQGAEQTSLEQEQGIAGINKEVSNLKSLQTQQLGQYLSGINTIEGKNISREAQSVGQSAAQRKYGIDALLTSSLLQAKQGNLTYAKELVDNAIKAKYEPIKARLETQQFILGQLNTKAARAEESKRSLQLKQLDKQMEDEKTIQNLSITASGNGAPPSVLDKLTKAKTFAEAIAIGGAYMSDPLDRSIKSAQLRKLQLENVANDPEKQQAIINSVVNEKDPTKLISNFFKVNPKMKTNPAINDAAAVVSSANELAKTLGGGKIKGYGFFGGGFLPEAFASQDSISNRSKIKALNLKVQQWASGASLTKQQTKYVMGMIPERNDTDATFRNKVNNLSNYMLSDIKGRATTQGSQFEYVPVDLFGSKDSSVMPDVKKSVVQAVSSGYKPSEVVEYVNNNFPEQSAQIQQAREAGYSDDEIIQYLSL